MKSPSRTSSATTVGTEHFGSAVLLERQPSVQSGDEWEEALIPKAEPEDTVILDIAAAPAETTTDDASVLGASNNEHEATPGT